MEITMLQIGTILHPTDFSEHSKNALQVACALARDYGARLVVLHVANVPVIDEYQTVDPAIIRKEAEDQLHQLEIPMDNVRAERKCILGEDVSEILRCAKEIKADVIVMGTHGRTGLKRLLMGSVAEQVLRQAPCLVLTANSHLNVAPVSHKG